jgi:N-dimethylarginine dimethylaminohydrolase
VEFHLGDNFWRVLRAATYLIADHSALRHVFVTCLALHAPNTILDMAMRVLLCPPDYFDVIDCKNPYMSGKKPVDRARAKQQWQALCAALSQNGCEVETIPPVSGLEDMVFAANQVFVGSAAAIGKFIVPSHMVHESRQREVPFYVEWFRTRGYRVIDLDLGSDHLEGHGDLLWHPDGSRVYAGSGFRSTRGGVEKFSAAMSELGIAVSPLRLIDPSCYHLDTCLCPLTDEAALIYPEAFDSGSLKKLCEFWKRVYKLTADEAHNFMGNGIAVNGCYLAPHLTPHLDQILRQEGLKPVILDTSEFEKAGGSLFCMKAFLPER